MGVELGGQGYCAYSLCMKGRFEASNGKHQASGKD
jgi:hypothetical protein